MSLSREVQEKTGSNTKAKSKEVQKPQRESESNETHKSNCLSSPVSHHVTAMDIVCPYDNFSPRALPSEEEINAYHVILRKYINEYFVGELSLEIVKYCRAFVTLQLQRSYLFDPFVFFKKEEWVLEHFELTDEECIGIAIQLKENTIVTDLNISNNMLSGNAIEAIAIALNTNTTLRKLSVGSNWVGGDGAKSLAKSLDGNIYLRELRIDDGAISCDDVISLCEALHLNSVLVLLSLYNNRISDEGAIAVGNMLKINRGLTELVLQENDIEDEGAESIGNSLKLNTVLSQLNLSRNRIGDEGVVFIVDGLKNNNTLTVLELNGNYDIANNGAIALAMLLESNSTLTCLECAGNDIGEAGGRAFCNALKINTAMGVLDLTANLIPSPVATLLLQISRKHHNLEEMDPDMYECE